MSIEHAAASVGKKEAFASMKRMGSVYDLRQFRDLDVSATMRHGHPGIADTDQCIVDLVASWIGNRPRPRIFELGSRTGVLTKLLSDRLAHAEIISNEINPALRPMARRRLAGRPITYFDDPFEEWSEPVEVLISWGAHHHMPTQYLAHVRDVLVHDGLFVLADEFCPEYCDADALRRLAEAEVVFMAGGCVLTTREEVRGYEVDGTLPAWTRTLERRRQRALWTWYKYVVDYALDHDNLVVASAELQIARDDLVTDFMGEHKLSPAIVERSVELAGFRRQSRQVVGSDDESLQSFVVYGLVQSAQSTEIA